MTSVNWQMKPLPKSRTLLLAFSLTFMMMFTALAQAADPVGKLLFAIRGVDIVRADGVTEAGAKGSPLYAGDSVVTQEKGRAQILFIDGAKVALKPSTEFVIESYNAPATNSQGGLVASNAKSSSAVLGLLKGGMRAVSGSITKVNPDGMSIKTPVATMGIRGTDLTAVLVPVKEENDGGTGTGTGSGSGDGGDDENLELQVGVRDGSVRITNDNGSVDVNAGEFGTANGDSGPELSLNQPSGLAGSDENSEETTKPEGKKPPSNTKGKKQSGSAGASGSGSGEQTQSAEQGGAKPEADGEQSAQQGGGEPESSTGGGDSGATEESSSEGGEFTGEHNAPINGPGQGPSQPPAPPGPGPGAPENPPESSSGENLEDPAQAPTGGAVRHVAFAGTRDTEGPASGVRPNTDNELSFGANNELTSFTGKYLGTTQEGVLSIELAQGEVSAETQNLGFDSSTGFNWGRWSNGSATATPGPDGNNETIQLPGQTSIHWVYGAELNGPLSDITASASYSLIGNTDPTDAAGNVGVLGFADMTANFSTGDFSIGLQLGINNENWDAFASGTLDLGTSLDFVTTLVDGVISDGQTQTGSITGGSVVGSFSPNLVDLNGSPVPAGAGFAYGLESDSNSVTGIAIVGNPVDPGNR